MDNDAPETETKIETVEPPKTLEQDKLTPPLDQTPKWEAQHTFKLRTKVTPPNGDPFSTVTLRAPNGLDLLECGRPTYTLWVPAPDGKGQASMRPMRDDEAIRKWLGRLSGHPVAVFYTLPAGDLNAIIQWVIDEVATAGN